MPKSAIFLSILALTPLFSALSQVIDYAGFESFWVPDPAGCPSSPDFWRILQVIGDRK